MTIASLFEFLQASPTPWHAVENLKKMLAEAGFFELREAEPWKLELGAAYFVTRQDTSLCAFLMPRQLPKALRVVAAHTDSPGLKLKPHAEYKKENMTLWGVEVYGGPLLSSWMNRDLGIAGQIYYQTDQGLIEKQLLKVDDAPVVIPQLAIHLDRHVNEKGLQINPQDHLIPIAATDLFPYLETLLPKAANKLLGSDLFLYPLEPPRLIGHQGDLFASYRIDNLASVHASLLALLATKEPENDRIKMAIFWDHEEVGSNTAQGAGSPFLPQTIERILLSQGLSRETYFQLLGSTLCASVDMAHAFHPNYAEKTEPQHPCLLNHGVVIKHHAQQKYATSAATSALIANICKQHHLPFQHFVTRTDMPGGSTIGPITASLSGIPTIDIGMPELSMHSCRELAGCKDYDTLCKLLMHVLGD